MAYLGYKQKAFREHMKHQEKIRLWKEKEKEKKRQRRLHKNLFKSTVACIGVAIMIIALYALVFVTGVKAQPIGVGNFVMAVSYTDSYKDLQYVANFPNCTMAQNYYNQNCIDANIMICQLEEYLQLPESYSQEFTYASTDKQSCGFVGVQQTHTFIEE